MRDHARRPATLIPPPVVYAVALFAAWGLQREWPLPLELGSYARGITWLLVGIGLAGSLWAVWAVWKNRTTVNPYKAANALVTDGPFRYSRNPIYVSDWFIYAGVTVWLHSLWPLPLALLVYLVMRHWVIAHEEAHLAARFGEDYRDYCARVPRWL